MSFFFSFWFLVWEARGGGRGGCLGVVLGLDGSGANGTQDPRQDQRVKETRKGYIYDTHDDDNMKERGGRGGVRWEEEVDSLYQYTACWLHPEHPGRIYCQALGHAADVGQDGGVEKAGA